jgi:membrane protein YqaA with SNARE-associated domain
MTAFDGVWPLAAMMASAFAAGTLLPFSSEVALLAAVSTGLGSPIGLLIAASIGNVAGSCFNWWLGRHVRHFEGRRWFPFAPDTISKASQRFNRYGVGCLLLSWLPVIGDPLTFVAGLLRVPLAVFVPLVAIGKAGRYMAILQFA